MEPELYQTYIAFADARIRHHLAACRTDAARALVAETLRVLSRDDLEAYLSSLPPDEREVEVRVWQRGFRRWLEEVTAEDRERRLEVRRDGLPDELREHAVALVRRYAPALVPPPEKPR